MTTPTASPRVRRPARRVLELVTTMPWAITEEALRNIVQIASRENLAPEVIEARLGHPLDNTRTVTVRDGIATIPVTGPLMRYADWFTRISGATSYEDVAKDLTVALEDASVRAILFAVDSPGGEVNGCQELGELIYQARGQKPLVAHVSGLGCSGAYWLASAADEVVAGATAILGSIGVVQTITDTRERDAKNGVQRIEIVATKSPRKRLDVREDEGRAAVQAVLDALADQFIATVARNRGVSVEVVERDFGQGGVFVGQAAVTAGLADRLGTFEDVHAELVNRVSATRALGMFHAGQALGAPAQLQEQHMQTTAPGTQAPAASSPQQTTPAPARLTAEQLAAEYPTEVAAFRAEGATKERERILAIEALAIRGHEALIAECKKDPAVTPEMAAVRLVQAQQKAGQADAGARRDHLKAIEGDEQNITPPTPTDPNAAGAPSGDEAAVARILGAHRARSTAAATPAAPTR